MIRLDRLLLPATALCSLLGAAPSLAGDGITLDRESSRGGEVLPIVAAGVGFCDGNNHENEEFLDTVSMGGPLAGIEWIPAASVTVTRVEIFTGERSSTIAVGLWSDDGGAPNKPLAPLGFSADFTIGTPVTWYGAPLNVGVPVVAGQSYWVVWDPQGGEQANVTNNPADIQQTYWGSNTGTVGGGAGWDLGPFTFPDRRWKFRLACGGGGCPDADGDGTCDEDDTCPGTVAPEIVPLERLGVNRWALVDGDDTFDTTPPEGRGPQVTFTLEDTRGCSCEQIIEALHLGEGHLKFGCSTGVMRHWVALNSP